MTLMALLENLHFLRPLWLLALVPSVLLIWALLHNSQARNQWLNAIDAHLLKHLLLNQQQIKGRRIALPWFVLVALLLSILALAGPTVEKRPLPVFETEVSKVILLDLSLSMNATDIKPSRLTRAKHKINDLLSYTKEGQVALIVYAGDAFVISPLTTDARTIETLVPPLSPGLMPVLGSQPHRAFEVANELLENAGILSGQIIWITDGIDDEDYGRVLDANADSRHQVSILAVGTDQGAPIPLPDNQGFLKDGSGEIIIPSLGLAGIEQLAGQLNAPITELTPDDRDIRTLLESFKTPEEFIATEDDLEMDTWVELGPYLLLPVLIIAALAFRRGLVIALVVYLLPLQLFTSTPLSAAENEQELSDETYGEQLENAQKHAPSFWRSLWKNPDQQGADAFKDGAHAQAANLFESMDWKASALFRSGQLNASAEALNGIDTADAHYNRGNALAKLGRLQDALDAYNRSLEIEPGMEDAEYNKAIVEELLKRQQEQEEQEQQDQQEGDSQQDQENQEQQQEQQDQQEQQEQQQNQQQSSEEQQEEEQQEQEQQTDLEQMSEEERDQVLEQWLRMIKDDPGGLLRRKMYMEYQKRQQQTKELQRKGEKVW